MKKREARSKRKSDEPIAQAEQPRTPAELVAWERFNERLTVLTRALREGPERIPDLDGMRWSKHLSLSDRRLMITKLSAAARASRRRRDPSVLNGEWKSWEASAEVQSNPKRAARLTAPLRPDRFALPRPVRPRVAVAIRRAVARDRGVLDADGRVRDAQRRAHEFNADERVAQAEAEHRERLLERVRRLRSEVKLRAAEKRIRKLERELARAQRAAKLKRVRTKRGTSKLPAAPCASEASPFVLTRVVASRSSGRTPSPLAAHSGLGGGPHENSRRRANEAQAGAGAAHAHEAWLGERMRMRISFHPSAVRERLAVDHAPGWLSVCVLGHVLEVMWLDLYEAYARDPERQKVARADQQEITRKKHG